MSAENFQYEFACTECGNTFKLNVDRSPEPHYTHGFALCYGLCVRPTDPRWEHAVAKVRESTPEESERTHSIVQGAIDSASQEIKGIKS
jgi:hypothetical protein